MNNNNPNYKDSKEDHAKYYSYPEQFFTVKIINLSLKEKPSVESIHLQEWDAVIVGVDSTPDFKKDNTINYQSLYVEKQLNFYLKNPNNSKQEFIKHFQYMLNNHSSDMKESIRSLLNGWLNYHLDMLNHPEKEEFLIKHKETIDSLPDQRTRAYYIHFHIQLASIPKDNDHGGVKFIEKPKFMDYFEDIQIYNLYLKVRASKDSIQNKKRCCNYLLSISEEPSTMFSLVKSYLSNLDK
jgi:hypothetical protein